jgi:hypothetical protein
MTTTRSDKGTLTINGERVLTEWDLKLSREYVDATVFGDVNKDYLVDLTNVDITYHEPVTDFNASAAKEMYDDDPVALAIIDRLDKMEREAAFLREEKAELRRQNDRLSNELIRRIPQFKADDPVKNRKKAKNARKTGR